MLNFSAVLGTNFHIKAMVSEIRKNYENTYQQMKKKRRPKYKYKYIFGIKNTMLGTFAVNFHKKFVYNQQKMSNILYYGMTKTTY
jgi:hypothetical protein